MIGRRRDALAHSVAVVATLLVSLLAMHCAAQTTVAPLPMQDACTYDQTLPGCTLVVGDVSTPDATIIRFIKFGSSEFLDAYPFGFEFTSSAPKKPSKQEAAFQVIMEQLSEVHPADEECPAEPAKSCSFTSSRSIRSWPDVSKWTTDYSEDNLHFNMEQRINTNGVPCATIEPRKCAKVAIRNEVVGALADASIALPSGDWVPDNTSMLVTTRISEWEFDAGKPDATMEVRMSVDAKDQAGALWASIDDAGTATDHAQTAETVDKPQALGAKLRARAYLGDAFVELRPEVRCDGAWKTMSTRELWFESDGGTLVYLRFRLPRFDDYCEFYYTIGFAEGTIVTDFSNPDLSLRVRIGIGLAVGLPACCCCSLILWCILRRRRKRKKKRLLAQQNC